MAIEPKNNYGRLGMEGKIRPAAGPSTGTVPAVLRSHPHLYQINTWAWLDELSRTADRTVTLHDVPDREWDRLKDLGFDLIYLLGVWNHSKAGRHIFRTDPHAFETFDRALPGWTLGSVVGSPFSISGYSPDRRIGTWDDLDRVRSKLHARGMRLILDFIPNHVGPDHPWISQHPDYLMQGTERDFQHCPSDFLLIEPDGQAPYFIARGRDPYFDPWADTAQIDYFNPATRKALIEILKVVGSHCDGLRCDMAMLVLNDVFGRTWGHLLAERERPEREFWSDAIAALPDGFIWMAEVYWDMEADLQELGFTYTYDKRLYDRLKAADGSGVRGHLSAEVSYQSHMARFLENHDEPRSVPTFGRERVPVLAALIATLPGLRFFHQGQFVGKEIHLPMPLNRAIDEPPDMALAAIYEHILAIGADPAFHSGAWRLLEIEALDDSTANLLAYRWQGDEGYRAVILNLGPSTAQGRIRLAGELPPSAQYDFADRLNGETYIRDRSDLETNGLYVRLEGYRGHVFAVFAHAA